MHHFEPHLSFCAAVQKNIFVRKMKVQSKKSSEYPPLRPVLDRWQQVGDSCAVAVSRRAILIRWETESCRGHRRIVRVNILPRPPELWLETTDNVATMAQQSPELLTHSGHWWKLNCGHLYSGEHKYWHTLPTCSINNKVLNFLNRTGGSRKKGQLNFSFSL